MKRTGRPRGVAQHQAALARRQSVGGVSLKECTKCGQWQRLSAFSADASKWDGLRPSCRSCNVKPSKKRGPQALPGHRICTKCGMAKPEDGFHKDQSKPGGIYPACKECRTSGRHRRYLQLLATGYKHCGRCGQTKPLSEFYVRKSESRPVANCKSCSAETVHIRYERDPEKARVRARAYRQQNLDRVKERAFAARLAQYDLSADEYEQMVADQRGRCAICGRIPPKLSIDHDHSTGRVRGLLCRTCNLAIGHLGDNAEGLFRAYIYVNGKTAPAYGALRLERERVQA